MRLLIIGTLNGQIGAASQIAMKRGVKVQQVGSEDAALDALRAEVRERGRLHLGRMVNDTICYLLCPLGFLGYTNAQLLWSCGIARFLDTTRLGSIA